MKQPPPNRTRIRLTIDVEPEVYEAFRQLAGNMRIGIGRAMGDWLADTKDAVTEVSALVADARAKPGAAAKRLHSYALGLATAAEGLIESASGPATDLRSKAAAGHGRRNFPPSCNTGGKPPTPKGKP